MKSVLQLRWLVIDEISMVSANLLADIDTTLRSLARDVDVYARDKKTFASFCRSQLVMLWRFLAAATT